MHPQVTVHVLHRDVVASVLPFSQPLIRIGRLRDAKDGPNDIVLNAPRVSASHAHIVVDHTGVTIVDHSVNGTFVNGEPIKAPRLLAPGDTIEIDAYTLRCEPTSSPAAQPEPPPDRASALPRVPVDDELLLLDLPPVDLPPVDLPPVDLPPVDLPPVGAPASGPSAASDTGPALPALDVPAAPPSLPESPPPPRLTAVDRPPDQPLPAGAPLARLYRTLAAQLGAPAWGRPPPLDGGALPRVTAAARQAALGLALPPGPWPERIARELCDLGPLASLLDDPAVTQIVVRGHEGIDVRRGTQREQAAGSFSCPEAIHAVLERWTGAPLEYGRERALPGDLLLHAWGPALSPCSPLLTISRARSTAAPALEDLVVEHALPRPAADLLLLALRRDLNVLVHGGPGADLSRVLVALAGELPPARGLAVLRRASAWPKGHALFLDGHDPAAWPCARRLAADWLVVEELVPADLPQLVALARHHGGGTLASVRAAAPEAAVQRLAAMLATSQGALDLSACRLAVAGCFDVVLGVRPASGDRLRIDSLAEVRPRGELAELFAWKPDASSVEPTTLTPQVLR